jgi:hypothetical protein
LQGIYVGCTNSSILCIDPESSALLGTTAALQPEPAAAAVSIAVNKEAVVSASSSSPQLEFYSRCSASSTSSGKQQQQQQQGSGLQLLGSARASTQGKNPPVHPVMPLLPSLTCQQTPMTAACKLLLQWLLQFHMSVCDGSLPAVACKTHLAFVPIKPAAMSVLPPLLLMLLLEWLLTVHLQLAGCASLCFGGPLHKDLVVSTTDGSILLLTRNSNAGSSSSNPSDVQVRCYLCSSMCSLLSKQVTCAIQQ